MYKHKTDDLIRNMMWQAVAHRNGKFAGVVNTKFALNESRKNIQQRLKENTPDGLHTFGYMWATSDFDNPRRWTTGRIKTWKQ